MIELPKLLIVTEWAPSAPGGGPAILRQMVRNYPPDLLFWWSCLPAKSPVPNHHCAQIPSRLYPHRRLVEIKARLLEKLWLPFARRHLLKVIQKLNPDAIWHVPHKWAIPVAHTVLLPKGRQLHVTMQDYMDMTANLPLLGSARAQSFAKMADALYGRAETRDATSHAMIEDLLARTGVSAEQMVHAGLEEEDFNALREAQPRPSEIRIAYAGTIQVESTFLFFVDALKTVRHSLPQKMKLIFFGSHRYSDCRWFEADWMEERGHLDLPLLHQQLRQCSWGISIMALNDDIRYNRYSFPTKFISYLAGGLPIFTLAHPKSSVYQMAAKYGVGVETSTTSRELLAQQLRASFSDLDAKERFRPAVLRCARTEFNAQKMRGTLQDCFQRCAEAGRRIGS